jgi:hypothetical protein
MTKAIFTRNFERRQYRRPDGAYARRQKAGRRHPPARSLSSSAEAGYARYMHEREDDSKSRFSIAAEDVGFFIAAACCLAMMLGLVYFVFLMPSPFEKWFDTVNGKPAATKTQAVPKKDVMMPSYSVPPEDQEKPEKPEKPKP